MPWLCGGRSRGASPGLCIARPRRASGLCSQAMAPRTRYAKHGDLNIAYQVTGEGPIDIVVVPSFVSNIEFWWAHPVMKAWWDRVTSFARLILFDKLGTGCSDPVSGPRTLEQRSDEIKAVME